MSVILLATLCEALVPPESARWRTLTSRSTRRSLLLAAPLAALLPQQTERALAADPYDELYARLQAPVVPEAGDGNAMQGRPAPPLPSWMAGRWQCEQTLTDFKLPLGVQYIGAPGRPLSEAEASAAAARSRVGKPVSLELRFDALATGGVAENRAYNSRSRLDAFAGRPVTKRARACAAAGVDAPGLACTLVEFSGPVSQKQIVGSLRVATRVADGRPTVLYSEFTRAIFARLTMPGDTRNFPPITTDSETVVSLTPDAANADVLRGRLRLIDYLNPYDPLYFSAGRKSVSINDYELTLTRLAADATDAE